MENLGSLAILLAFCAAIYAAAASVVGKIKHKPFLIVSGERAVYSVWVLVTLASAILVYALMTGDFRYAYVAEHSNHTMPLLYKFTAWWGGQEGSLLLWSWLLSTYAAVVAFTNRRKHRDFMPYVVGVLATVQTFFLILNNFIANAFQMLAQDKLIVAVPDGNGLSPLLQYPAMAIHPPMLYLGYVGFAVPFAFAIASLITRQPGEGWIHTTRRWTLVTWLFQSTGVMLGMAWAYHVLGWGGYWGWDPVENASAAALARRHGVFALGDDAGKEGHDEGLEHRADLHHLLPVHSRHLPHALRRGAVGARLRAVGHRQVFRQLHGARNRRHRLSDSRPAGLPQERIATGERGLARIELPVQQPDPAGELLRGAVGHAVPGDFRSRHGRQDLARFRLVQPADGADRPVPALPHRRGPAVCVAEDFGREPAAQFPISRHCGAGAGRALCWPPACATSTR